MVMSVRIGGKGAARRKKKMVHRANNAADDKKLQATLKKLNCHTLPGVDEAIMLMEDGTLLHIEALKEVQFGMASNVMVIKGQRHWIITNQPFVNNVNIIIQYSAGATEHHSKIIDRITYLLICVSFLG